MPKEIKRVFDVIELYKKRKPDKVAFSYNIGSKWIKISNQEYVDSVDILAKALIKSEISKGDCIVTVLGNRPEWNYFDMAIMMAGAIQVPVYPTISKSNYNFVLNEIKPRFIIIENQEIAEKIKEFCNENPDTRIFSIDEINDIQNWKELLKTGKQNNDNDLLTKRKNSIDENDIATIIYTSGTTGNPKGVILSHKNIVSNFTTIQPLSGLSFRDRALSFLPLCHIYERTLNYLYQYIGLKIYYGKSYQTIPQDLKQCKPHVFCAVPRVLEKYYKAIVARGNNLPFMQRKIFFWALKIARQFDQPKFKPKYRLKLFIADKLVFRKWRKIFGDNIKVVVSGSASLRPNISKTFTVAGLKILEGYGLTEASPVIATSSYLPDGVKFGTVGKVIKDVDVKIAPDGEILCKGPNIMQGYYKQPELTKSVFDEEGWFHTGDIGEFIEGEYLKITDRKKEIFKTSNGKYVAPQPIECKFKESPFIDYIIVLGENRNFPSALIVPAFEYVKTWMQQNQIVYKNILDTIKNTSFLKKLDAEIQAINILLDKTEQIKQYTLIPDKWSVESGELSPTLKLRRRFIYKKYRSIIEDIYNQ